MLILIGGILILLGGGMALQATTSWDRRHNPHETFGEIFLELVVRLFWGFVGLGLLVLGFWMIPA